MLKKRPATDRLVRLDYRRQLAVLVLESAVASGVDAAGLGRALMEAMNVAPRSGR